MIPQLAISSGGSERDDHGRAGQGRFCRFVTLQCINEQTFIKAETVFSAIANCRAALARPTSSILRPLFPAASDGGMFFRGERTLESLPTIDIEFYINSRFFLNILLLLKSYSLDEIDIDDRICTIFAFDLLKFKSIVKYKDIILHNRIINYVLYNLLHNIILFITNFARLLFQITHKYHSLIISIFVFHNRICKI